MGRTQGIRLNPATVRHHRELRGWQQKDLAVEMGLTDTKQIERIESRNGSPVSPPFAKRVADALGTTIEILRKPVNSAQTALDRGEIVLRFPINKMPKDKLQRFIRAVTDLLELQDDIIVGEPVPVASIDLPLQISPRDAQKLIDVLNDTLAARVLRNALATLDLIEFADLRVLSPSAQVLHPEPEHSYDPSGNRLLNQGLPPAPSRMQTQPLQTHSQALMAALEAHGNPRLWFDIADVNTITELKEQLAQSTEVISTYLRNLHGRQDKVRAKTKGRQRSRKSTR